MSESDFDPSEVFEIAAGKGRGQMMSDTPGLTDLFDADAFERDEDVPGMDTETVAMVFDGDLGVVIEEADEWDEPDDDIPDILSEMGL